MENQSPLILITVVSLILIAVGLFVIVVFTSQVGMESSYTENFPVSNPSIEQTFGLSSKPSEAPSVTQYNGIQWLPVDSSYITYNAQELTILAGGLQG